MEKYRDQREELRKQAVYQEFKEMVRLPLELTEDEKDLAIIELLGKYNDHNPYTPDRYKICSLFAADGRYLFAGKGPNADSFSCIIKNPREIASILNDHLEELDLYFSCSGVSGFEEIHKLRNMILSFGIPIEKLKEINNWYGGHDRATFKEMLGDDSSYSHLGVSLADARRIQGNYPNSKVFEFNSHIGGTKPIFVLETSDKKKFVLRQMMEKGVGDEDYKTTYNRIYKDERRPRLADDVLMEDGRRIGLFTFVGASPMKWRDPKYLEQLAEMGINFSKRKTIFDDNPPNLVTHEGNLYYIDQDINYVSYPNMAIAVLHNMLSSMPHYSHLIKDEISDEMEIIQKLVIAYYESQLMKLPEKEKSAIQEELMADFDRSKGELKSLLERVEHNYSEEQAKNLKIGLHRLFLQMANGLKED